jgi:4-hydroxybenzoate polyprenyltransferase
MQSAIRAITLVLTLIAVVFSLAVPLYCIPTGLIALFRRASYSPWPPLLLTLGWILQWPLIFVLALTIPGAGRIAGDGHESVLFDFVLFSGFVLFNAGPLHWVYRHQRRFSSEE